MDGAGARDAGPAGLLVLVERTAQGAAGEVACIVHPREAHGLLEEAPAGLGIRAVGMDAGEPLERMLAGDLRMPGDQRLILRLGDRQLQREAFGIGEAQGAIVPRGVDPLEGQPPLPEVQRLSGSDAIRDSMDHARARPAGGGTRVLEEGQVGPRAPRLVAVEEMVDAGVILVDGLLDQAQPEHAGVEVYVPRRVARDGGDVMQSIQLHAASLRGADG